MTRQKEAEQRLREQDLETVVIHAHDGIELVGHWHPCEAPKQVIIAMHGRRSCTAPKRLLIVPGAGHGVSYLVEKERYEKAVKEFWADFD